MSDQPLDRDRITKLVSTIFADDLHAKRAASLAGAAVGVLEGAALGIHAIGNALAVAEGLKSKHAGKQVDRLLSNEGIPVWSLFASWVPYVVGDRSEIVTALDWTDFDDDDQSTIVLSMITSHGRATPLLWKTVMKSGLKGWRNEHEDMLLERLREVLPVGVKVTVLADRGFGDQALYELLKDRRQRVKHGADEITDIEQGADLGRALPSELGKLTHPRRRLEFFRSSPPTRTTSPTPWRHDMTTNANASTPQIRPFTVIGYSTGDEVLCLSCLPRTTPITGEKLSHICRRGPRPVEDRIRKEVLALDGKHIGPYRIAKHWWGVGITP